MLCQGREAKHRRINTLEISRVVKFIDRKQKGHCQGQRGEDQGVSVEWGQDFS